MSPFLCFFVLMFLLTTQNNVWGMYGYQQPVDIPGQYVSLKTDRSDGLKGYDKRKYPFIHYLNAPEREAVNPSITCEDASIFYAWRMGQVLERNPYAAYLELVNAFSDRQAFPDMHDLRSFYEKLISTFPRGFGKKAPDINEVVQRFYPKEIKDKTYIWGMGPGFNNFTPIKNQKDDVQDMIDKVIEGRQSYLIVISQSSTTGGQYAGHWAAILIRKTSKDSTELEIVIADGESGWRLENFYFSICYDIYQKWIIEVADPTKRITTQSVNDWIGKVDAQIDLKRELSGVKLIYLENTPEIKSLWEVYKEGKKTETTQKKSRLEQLRRQINGKQGEVNAKKREIVADEQELRRLEQELLLVAGSEEAEIKRLTDSSVDDELGKDKEYKELKLNYDEIKKMVPEDELSTMLGDLERIKARIRGEVEGRLRAQIGRIKSRHASRRLVLQRQHQGVESNLERERRELERLNEDVDKLSGDEKKIQEEIESAESIKKWIIRKIKKLKQGFKDKLERWDAGGQVDDPENRFYEALKSWYSSVYSVCKLKKAVGEDEYLNGTDHMPFFLPCNPAHLVCCKCLKEKIDATPLRIAREYNGVKRSGIYIDTCVYPLSEEFVEYIKDKYASDQIYLSFVSALYYQTLVDRNQISKDKKFDAENAINLLNEVYFTQEQRNQITPFIMLRIKNKAEEFAGKFEDVIYPATIELCHLVAFLSVGREWETSGHAAYNDSDMYLHNSDDIIFETVAYGASLENIFSEKDKIKHLGVKAKIEFLQKRVEELNLRDEAEKKELLEKIELCIWHGFPISKITPLIRKNYRKVGSELLPALLRVQPDILDRLKVIGNKARYFRAVKNKDKTNVFDEQEAALLEARRVKVRVNDQLWDKYSADKIPVEWESLRREPIQTRPLDELLSMGKDARSSILARYSSEQVEALKREINDRLGDLAEQIKRLQGTMPKPQEYQAKLSEWANGLFVKPDKKAEYDRLNAEYDRLEDAEDLDAAGGKRFEELGPILDGLRGPKPETFQEALEKWRKGANVKAENRSEFERLKVSREKLNEMTSDLEAPQAALPKIIGVEDKTLKEQVILLSQVDQFVSEAILREATQDQVDELLGVLDAVIREHESVSKRLEYRNKKYDINPEFYKLEADKKMSDENLKKLKLLTNAWDTVLKVNVIKEKLEKAKRGAGEETKKTEEGQEVKNKLLNLSKNLTALKTKLQTLSGKLTSLRGNLAARR